jgi:broad specificity phosphatase PhoE
LYLVRHGATSANERQPPILQGNGIDLPLSATGERQAAALGRFLRDFPLAQVYCSTMLRACQTAAAVAEPHGLVVQKLPGLVECSVGEWEGLDWETIRRKHPEPCARFLDNPAEFPYLGGESYGNVYRRTQPVLHDLLERHRGESIIVVAHNVVNRVYLAALLGVELRRAKELKQQNACINLISHTAHATALVTMNAIFHLDEFPL